MSIETLDDWNKLLECCCEMPACPVPLETCVSISGQLTSQGFRDPADTEWKRYRKHGTKYTLVASGSTTATGPGDYGTFTSSTYSMDAEYFSGDIYERLHYGAAGCESFPAADPVNGCDGLGNSERTTFAIKTWSTGIPPNTINYVPGADTFVSSSFVSVAGEETDEFAAWRLEFPTDEDFSDAVAAWEDYLAAEEQYQADYLAWVDGGSIGDPPAEPEFVAQPTSRPAEFYAPCTWRITESITIYAHYFGYNSTGVSAAPTSDPEAFEYWYLNDSGSTGPPCPGSASRNYITTSNPLTAIAPTPLDGDDIVTTSGAYEEGVTLAEWKTLVEGIITAELSFPSECSGTECSALRYEEGSVDAPLDDATLILRTSQTSWDVDDSHGGTVFHLLFDVLEEPDGWDDTIDDPDYEPPIPNDPPEPVPQVPKPGRPSRSWVAQDVEREWTGPGTGPQSDPSWNIGAPYVIDPPSVPGTRRIVNRRFWCYPNSPYGYKPQVTGEGVELP